MMIIVLPKFDYHAGCIAVSYKPTSYRKNATETANF